MGTSSMLCGLMSGRETPWGMRSKLVCSFWLRLTMASSKSVPT